MKLSQLFFWGLLAYVKPQEEFDYIVVGGGTAGGTLAVDLARKGHKTLLIEAGPNHSSEIIATPAFSAAASEDPTISWEFFTKHHSGATDTFYYPRVGGLGGCAIHNAMITIYPNSRDFELMEEVTGDSGFSEPNMREYFKIIENNQYQVVDLMNQHGFSGWLSISYLNALKVFKLDYHLINLFGAAIGNFLIDINAKLLGKLNTDKEHRIFIPQAVDNFRFTRADFIGHINQARSRYGLTIWTETFVKKLRIINGRTTGVEYERGAYLYHASPLSKKLNPGPSRFVGARREVIVSGGAFNTPQILKLSGIGDRRELAQFNIPLVADLPGVGRNLMDRYEIPVVIEFPKNLTITEKCTFKPSVDEDPCFRDYKEWRTGPYTTNGLLSGELKKSHPNLNEPDLFYLNTLSNFHGYFKGYTQDIASYRNRFSQIILKAHTHNNLGTVNLRSANPFDVPEINFHSFEDGDEDLQALVTGIKYSRQFLSRLNDGSREIYPGPNVRTDRQLRDYIQRYAWGHHACCTAKIGKNNDPMAVLDGQFRVRQVSNLRVVDASIFPKIPGYFPNLYIHMMAMRASDIISPPFPRNGGSFLGGSLLPNLF